MNIKLKTVAVQEQFPLSNLVSQLGRPVTLHQTIIIIIWKIVKENSSTTVELGSCAKYNCDWRIYFIIPCLVIACFSTFLQVVPGTMVGQAVVPDHLRTAALGLQALLFRAFGTIPLPIIAAKIIDSKCYWWGTSCMNERGACRAFDKYGMRTRKSHCATYRS